MLISDFLVMCTDCGRKYEISSDSLMLQHAYSERPMGTEIQHIFYGGLECKCGNSLSFGIHARYYF